MSERNRLPVLQDPPPGAGAGTSTSRRDFLRNAAAGAVIADAVTDVFAGRTPRRALPARDCETSCAGPGTGCG